MLILKILKLFDDIVSNYKSYVSKDINLGSTQFGIHRDDFVFSLDGQDAKVFASEGQQKNSVISFKLAELEIFNLKNNEYPILILDDLFSELDLKKIGKILNYISKDIQTFITTTDLKKIKKSYLKNSKIFRLNNGVIEEDLYE